MNDHEQIEVPPVLRPPPVDPRPVYRSGGMSQSAMLLHEIIIRALQMVLNGWKKYLDDEKKRNQQE